MKILSVSKTYNGKKILDIQEMEIQKGKIYAIIGANGSGKSTMAKVLAGIEKPDRGTAFEEKITVGYMPQKSYAFAMSVRNNVLLNGNNQILADDMLKKIGMWNFAEKKANRLSGGETARMALVRLMMKNYDVVIFDEPTASMDMESTLTAEDMITAYMERTGAAVLLITHSLSQAKRIADEIIFMHDGKVKEKGPAEKILSSPENDETKKFLEFFGVEF